MSKFYTFNDGYIRSSNNLHYMTITICNRITERKTSEAKQKYTKISPLGNPTREENPTNLCGIDSLASTMSSSTIQELNALPHKDPENKTR